MIRIPESRSAHAELCSGKGGSQADEGYLNHEDTKPQSSTKTS